MDYYGSIRQWLNKLDSKLNVLMLYDKLNFLNLFIL